MTDEEIKRTLRKKMLERIQLRRQGTLPPPRPPTILDRIDSWLLDTQHLLMPALVIAIAITAGITVRTNRKVERALSTIVTRTAAPIKKGNHRFALAMDYVLATESGYANHKADRGGPTNIGISLRFLRSIDADDADTNGDDRVDIQDVRSMTLEQASKLYKKYFYKPCRIDEFEDARLATKFFDMAVNLGPQTAAKLLQGVLGVQKTGKVGVTTLTTANAADGPQTLKALQAALESHYQAIADKIPSQRVFLKGWLKRARRIPT